MGGLLTSVVVFAVLLGVPALGVLGPRAWARRKRRRVRRLPDQDRRLQRLLDVPDGSLAQDGLAGRWAGRNAHVAQAPEGDGVRFSLGLGSPALQGLCIHAGTGGDPTGDAAFDAAVVVRGEPSAALTAWDEHSRGALIRLVGRERGGVEDGVIWVERRGTDLDDAGARRALTVLAELAAVLDGAPPDPLERLGRLALEDPQRAVRRQTVEVLHRDHGDHPVTARTLAALKTDPVGELRLLALTLTGDIAGTEAMVRSPAVSSTRRALALAQLRVWLSWDVPEALVQLALSTGKEALVLEAADALTERGPGLTPASLAALRQALDAGVDGPGRLAVVAALGACGGPAELVLLGTLAEEGSRPVRAAAEPARAALLARLGERRAGALAVVDAGQDAAGGLVVVDGSEPAGRLSLDHEG